MVHPKKLSRGCLRVRPDANANADAKANADADADANCSKTICQPPLKGGRHKNSGETYYNKNALKVKKVKVITEIK